MPGKCWETRSGSNDILFYSMPKTVGFPMAVRAAETGTGIAKEIRDKYTRSLKIFAMHILFQTEKCKKGLQSFVIVFVCTREPILSILP